MARQSRFIADDAWRYSTAEADNAGKECDGDDVLDPICRRVPSYCENKHPSRGCKCLRLICLTSVIATSAAVGQIHIIILIFTASESHGRNILASSPDLCNWQLATASVVDWHSREVSCSLKALYNTNMMTNIVNLGISHHTGRSFLSPFSATSTSTCTSICTSYSS